jgi:hypothetical protein
MDCKVVDVVAERIDSERLARGAGSEEQKEHAPKLAGAC